MTLLVLANDAATDNSAILDCLAIFYKSLGRFALKKKNRSPGE
jgi:hypothetical protein